MNKLKKSTLPDKHTKGDFKCFGPIATTDAIFEGTMLCDMGCFKQGEVDSNKYYHAAIVQSTINNLWYVYFEYGRTGSTLNPQFQFIECNDKNEAEKEYSKQLHKKNDRRGQWVDNPVLGRVLQPKPGKDCYLVRPQNTRSVGLPDGRNIGIQNKTVKASAAGYDFDKESNKLMADLNIGTLEYARSSISNSVLPTLDTVLECRKICDEATKICNGLNKQTILKSTDLNDLTGLIYSRIPRYKSRTKEKSDWLLTPQNIKLWRDDLDAFESAIKSYNISEVHQEYPFILEHLNNNDMYKFVHNWFSKATRNKHRNVGQINVKNIWKITKKNEWNNFLGLCRSISVGGCEKPLHQVFRKDIDEDYRKLFDSSNTCLLFHGSKSVNTLGILRESLRLPKQLSGVSITGWAYGSGCYFADDYKKSVGYTSYRNAYWSRGNGGVKNRGAFLFIADVLMGKPHIPKSVRAYKEAPSGTHSLFAKFGKYSGFMNNEIIVFNPSQINLRYLVEFN